MVPCPSCETESPKIFTPAVYEHRRVYDQAVDGSYPNAHKPKVIKRLGGGKAAQVRETGGYRPMVTHITRCPKEKRDRNVAILGELAEGKRLNCEACGYIWLYQAKTTDYPLVNTIREDFRPPRRIFMDSSVPLHSGYTTPERGA